MARYADAIFWIAANDDTEWIDHQADSAEGSMSVTATLVCDIFNKDEKTVREDLKRELKRHERQS